MSPRRSIRGGRMLLRLGCRTLGVPMLLYTGPDLSLFRICLVIYQSYFLLYRSRHKIQKILTKVLLKYLIIKIYRISLGIITK